MKRKNYNRKGLFLLDATSTVLVDGTWIIFHLPSCTIGVHYMFHDLLDYFMKYNKKLFVLP